MGFFRLLAVYLKVGVLSELEYRVNFYIQLLRSAIGLTTGLAGLSIVFGHTDTLWGWRQPELLALLGVYFLGSGLIGLVIQPSMQRFMEDVRQGTLDFVLTKPEDSQVLVSVRQVQIWKVVDLLLGVVVIGIALVQLGEAVGFWQAVSFVVALLSGATIIYAFWLMLATLSFWFVKIENILVIFQSMYQAGRWPVGIYPLWLRSTLTFVVPVAFATTVPAEALAGRLTPETLAGSVALAAVLLVVSRRVWSIGVRQYAGASA
ncbi:MAG: Efflux ABC transporter, permease protein [uncultured Chloroflexi bacterium]|uniref:Efflux ABC transporter, permease protein n=1 Tax=uncultured Chloroflexota bacterium TaxID=166587 RepID=A0A6J4IUA7_9CHLR|nr:MAG: Efflux ABC transporter, permease protein [uncultured Chloroflexota bacterium]